MCRLIFKLLFKNRISSMDVMQTLFDSYIIYDFQIRARRIGKDIETIIEIEYVFDNQVHTSIFQGRTLSKAWDKATNYFEKLGIKL